MPIPDHSDYFNAILAKAKEAALALHPDDCIFDPQGRLLVEVDCTDIDARIQRPAGQRSAKKTTVSLDVSDYPNIQKRIKDSFKNSLTSIIHLPQQQGVSYSAAITEEMIKDAKAAGLLYGYNEATKTKGSINALAQEFYFHLQLTLRTYAEAIPLLKGVSFEQMNTTHKMTMRRVNEALRESLVEFLVSRNGQIDSVSLNTFLDKERKKMMGKMHRFLLEEIAANTGIVVKGSDLLSGKELKEIAEKLTATENDILHLNNELGLCTWIAGSNHTAHTRHKGKNFADRQIVTCAYENGLVQENQNPRLQIRTHSIAVKKGLANDKAYIADVVEKLKAVNSKYDLAQLQDQDADNGKPQAFVYNLLTALNHRLGDTGGNLQTQSATHILKGAHAYNRAQASENPPVFCFVQNISVNNFGDALGEGKGALVDEATLMSEIALLHTLYDGMNKKCQAEVDDVFKSYGQFLNGSDEYFSQTQEGINAKEKIDTIKSLLNKNNNLEENSLLSNIQTSLEKMLAHNLHHTADGRLIQTLSVFLEKVSLVGCKSGNERAQMVNGRVAILDALLNAKPDKLSPITKQLFESLETNFIELANAVTFDDAENKALVLEATLDEVYNELGLQSGASLVSLVDQGSTAKVEARPDGNYFNTNFAEASTSVMTNLAQSKAGAMQAHKGLTDYMRAESGARYTSWEIMTANAFRNFACFATLGLFPLVVFCVVTPYTNYKAYLTEKNLKHTLEKNALNYTPKLINPSPAKATSLLSKGSPSSERHQVTPQDLDYNDDSTSAYNPIYAKGASERQPTVDASSKTSFQPSTRKW